VLGCLKSGRGKCPDAMESAEGYPQASFHGAFYADGRSSVFS